MKLKEKETGLMISTIIEGLQELQKIKDKDIPLN